MNHDKIIGTLAPLSSLKSSSLNQTGTLAVGLKFLDWLTKTHQHSWQLLPLHQTHLEPKSATVRAPSPYKGYGIGLNPKLLSSTLKTPSPTKKQLKTFSHYHPWLDSYSLFCALADQFKTDYWPSWPSAPAHPSPQAINNHQVIQFKLHYQYSQLKIKAQKQAIKLIGDLSFYLPTQSPLVWANQHLFDLNSQGQPQHFSGLPDGPKAHFGRQVWGHPLYKWSASNTPQILSLFKTRLQYLKNLFDYIRFDHTKGFYFYGSMHPANPKKDQLLSGPGSPFLTKLIKYCQNLNLTIFAEDSGDRLKNLRKTLQKLHVPGIRIFRYSHTTHQNQDHFHLYYADTSHYPSSSFAYTTTHDTQTLLGFINSLTINHRRILAQKSHIAYSSNPKTLAKNFRSAVINSPSRFIIIPLQDWLLITDRINVPGTEKATGDPNWRLIFSTPVENLSQINLKHHLSQT